MQLGKWVAQICGNGMNRYLGSFSTEVEAARAYDRERVKLGRKAVNFPDSGNKRQRFAAGSTSSPQSSAAIGVGDRIFVKAWGKGYEYTVESIALSGVAQLASADDGEDAQANISKCSHAS